MTGNHAHTGGDGQALKAVVIIPAFNYPDRLHSLLSALALQDEPGPWKVVVVDDGSREDLGVVAARFPEVAYIRQAPAGPSVARNLGARSVEAEIVVFIDQDCVPEPDWLREMLLPFGETEIVGSKGIYKTGQKSAVARFVQAEYEEKFALLAAKGRMNFVDGFSAAFRRKEFLACGGFDTGFPFPSVEDRELSFRLGQGRPCFRYCGRAVVSHLHTDSLLGYCRKKFKYGFWGVEVMRRFPALFVGDDHTPNSQRFQLLAMPVLPLALGAAGWGYPLFLLLWAAFFFSSTLSLLRRACAQGGRVCLLAPFLVFFRALALFLGLTAGAIAGVSREGPGFLKAVKAGDGRK